MIKERKVKILDFSFMMLKKKEQMIALLIPETVKGTQRTDGNIDDIVSENVSPCIYRGKEK